MHLLWKKKSLHILVTGETSLEKNGQEAGPATPTSTTSHMLASERGETSATQEETSTAQVSLRNSGGLAVQTGRGDFFPQPLLSL